MSENYAGVHQRRGEAAARVFAFFGLVALAFFAVFSAIVAAGHDSPLWLYCALVVGFVGLVVLPWVQATAWAEAAPTGILAQLAVALVVGTGVTSFVARHDLHRSGIGGEVLAFGASIVVLFLAVSTAGALERAIPLLGLACLAGGLFGLAHALADATGERIGTLMNPGVAVGTILSVGIAGLTAWTASLGHSVNVRLRLFTLVAPAFLTASFTADVPLAVQIWATQLAIVLYAGRARRRVERWLATLGSAAFLALGLGLLWLLGRLFGTWQKWEQIGAPQAHRDLVGLRDPAASAATYAGAASPLQRRLLDQQSWALAAVILTAVAVLVLVALSVKALRPSAERPARATRSWLVGILTLLLLQTLGSVAAVIPHAPALVSPFGERFGVPMVGGDGVSFLLLCLAAGLVSGLSGALRHGR